MRSGNSDLEQWCRDPESTALASALTPVRGPNAAATWYSFAGAVTVREALLFAAGVLVAWSAIHLLHQFVLVTESHVRAAFL
jgi:hypothetical protein